ncbi:MAG: CrcB protein, partial [Rhodothermales bacterium]
MVAKLLWIASGGAIGAVLRYLLVAGIHRFAGAQYPWGTFGVNVVGSLAIGLVWGIAERTPLSAGAAAFLFIGVLGAFTTFSTFSLETVDLYREGRHFAALLNLLLSNAVCIAAAFGGLKL